MLCGVGEEVDGCREKSKNDLLDMESRIREFGCQHRATEASAIFFLT
jgi:hypothetical protein